MYVFYPVPRGQELPVTSVESVEVRADGEIYQNARAVKISFDDGRIHYFLQADQGGESLNFADFSTDAEAVLIRIARDGSIDSMIEVSF